MQRLVLRISYCSTKIVDGTLQDYFPKLQMPAPRTHGGAERALDRRKCRFNHPAAIVAVRVHAGVVSVIERVVQPMLDEWTNSVLAEFVPERFRVVAFVCGQTEQVAGVAPGDLRADLRVVFLRRGAVNVGDVERLDVDESRDLQRADAVVRSLNVVAAGLIAVEAGRIDRSMASAFLG